MSDKHYLRLLSESYPTAAQVRSRIIRLKAVLSLPKGTEYFFSDLHGEYRAFIHLLNSASGVIHDTIDTLFSVTLTEDASIPGYLMLSAQWERNGTTVHLSSEGLDKKAFITVLKELI